ncbi:hypothetical protein GIB67_024120 [Kingdonia uniflora]|uniref:NAD(+) synthase (glutamine-hydrolyzing) n=1 Tax=Kingdonia uniflora TaxID=39325 RepID=A0A7J7MMY4_9MAGN|nr:hypothetical protein GIB67_024120 [Kingdonia uniflora]
MITSPTTEKGSPVSSVAVIQEREPHIAARISSIHNLVRKTNQEIWEEAGNPIHATFYNVYQAIDWDKPSIFDESPEEVIVLKFVDSFWDEFEDRRKIANGDEQVKADAVRVGQYTDGQFPTDSREFAKRIFYTVFMGSENSHIYMKLGKSEWGSSEATKLRAKVLADEIGSWHLDVSIDTVISAFLSLFKTLSGKSPCYKVDGGSNTENLGLQNIQARVRMVLAFMLASLMPWVHNKRGFYLVLGSSNVDEGLRGYLTKYDCSSADINPIGSISKQDLRSFLQWAVIHLGYPSLAEIEAAPPTAELEPIRSNYNQLDEVDMGMTYEELSVYGRLRKIFRCGPVSMFQNLCFKWGGKLPPLEIADKVKHFFKYYSINRHKMTVITPSYHAESYSPEDNRFDLRQFLYNARWPYQFRKIDELVSNINGDKVADAGLHGQENATGITLDHGGGMGVIAAGSGDPKTGL